MKVRILPPELVFCWCGGMVYTKDLGSFGLYDLARSSRVTSTEKIINFFVELKMSEPKNKYTTYSMQTFILEYSAIFKLMHLPLASKKFKEIRYIEDIDKKEIQEILGNINSRRYFHGKININDEEFYIGKFLKDGSCFGLERKTLEAIWNKDFSTLLNRKINEFSGYVDMENSTKKVKIYNKGFLVIFPDENVNC